MSSARGQAPRGRSRGSNSQAPGSRGSSRSRGRDYNSIAQRGGTARLGPSFGRPTTSNAARVAAGSTRTETNGFAQGRPSAQTTASSRAKATGSWQERYQTLTIARDKERADAIRRGHIADPDKPRSLSEAITPIGTCQEMCAEFERVQRVVQKDVWAEETDPNHSAFASTDEEPDESRMVKKFRRSAAGLEEPLPSDLRPPPVLKKTCDYLFNDVIGNAETLAKVHHFVWDRTRAIRTDFSIQQLTRTEDLRIAVECYERIARFHIVSLHLLASPQRPYSKYDWQQERAQLDATLLSLMQYYDDSRGHFEVPNEAEFRAYCVIFQLQDRIPDLEDRVQTWPRHIVTDWKVQKALDIYMAACNVLDQQGPFKDALASHLIARQDWQRFWNIVASKEMSYLMACVAEMYFNLVRRTVLAALFRTSRANSSLATPDWTLDVLVELLAFDNTDQVYDFCDKFGFSFREREDGEPYLDLTSVKGRNLPQPAAGMAQQLKSSLVEDKRFGRTVPAIIDGISVQFARGVGMVEEEKEEEEEEYQSMDDINDEQGERLERHEPGDTTTMDEESSLFMPRTDSTPAAPAPIANGTQSTPMSTVPSLFSGLGKGSTFGQPSTSSDSQSIFAVPQPTASVPQATGTASQFSSTNPFSARSGNTFVPSAFNFLETSSAEKATEPSDQPVKSPFQVGATSTPDSALIPPSSTPPAESASSLFNFTADTKANDYGESISVSLPGEGPFQQAKSSFQTAESSQPEDPIQFPGSTPALKPAAPSLFQPFSDAPAKESRPEWSSNQGLKAPPLSPGLLQQQIPWNPLPSDTSTAAAPASTAQTFVGAAPEVKAPQPHSNTSVLSPTPIAGHHSNLTPFTSGIKRSSSASDNRPKKPSPLSNSITAADEVAIDDAPAEVPDQPHTHHTSPTDDFESHLTRVANEFFHAPVAGVLHQYVRYHVGHTISEVKEELQTEQANAKADDFRHRSLSIRYGKLWRSLFWQQKLFKSGRQRRQRRQRRLEERASVEHETSSAVRCDSRSRSGSRSESVLGRGIEPYKIDANMGSRWSKPLATQPQVSGGSERPSSSHEPDSSTRGRMTGHKRLKSTSYVDDRGRVKKPATTPGQPNTDLLKRSSFLAFSADKHEGTIKNTTASSYFRLKAMGMHRIDNAASPRGTKRRLSGSMQSSTQTSPPALRTSLLRKPSETPPVTRALMPPPTSAPPRASQRPDDDEALFARLRAARDNLSQSTAYYKDEVSRDDEMRKSFNASQSSNEFESPSMAKARVEAKSRHASNAASDDDVPAYRLRESRFVPRQHYARAIERAKENIEARSRESSRPESRTSVDQFDKAIAEPGLSMSLSAPGQTQSQPSPPKMNGFHNNVPSHTQLSWFSQAGPSNTQPSHSLQSINFSDHKTEIASGNPFLTAGNPEDSYSETQPSFEPISQTKLPVLPTPLDHTIQPSQINEALAKSFGESHGHGQNRMLSMFGNTRRFAQQDSYLHTQEVSILSDDKEDDEGDVADPSIDRSQVNGNGGLEDFVDETEEESEEELHQTFGHANTYAALAHDGDTEDEEHPWSNEEGDEDGYDGDEGDYDDFDDDDAIDGDVDEDETQDANSEEYDRTYGYKEAQVPQTTGWRPPARSPSPLPNVAMHATGNTAEEPMELSD